MDKRGIDLTVLANIKAAWSSPSACVKSNWCRIPSAVIIALGLLILFTFFCCCAQCLSCCCCRPRRSRGFNDTESGTRALLPQNTAYGRTDLPAMPSYKMDTLKTPQYAIIGDDGSVMTDDPEKRMREDFPATATGTNETEAHNLSQTRDYTGPDFSEPAVSAPQDIFSNANGSFHDTLLNQQQSDFDTPYAPSPAASAYPPSYRSGVSPPRRNAQRQQPYGATDAAGFHAPTLPSQQILAPRGPRAPTSSQSSEPRLNSSRGEFNEGGPFPIIGRKAVNNNASVEASTGPFDRTDPTMTRSARLPSPPRLQYRDASRAQYQSSMDRPESPAPYPANSPSRHNLLADDHEFDPFSARRGHF